MKNKIVADGRKRLLAAQNAKRLKTVHAKFASELARSNVLKQIWLRLQIWRESTNQKPAAHQPSAGTLW